MRNLASSLKVNDAIYSFTLPSGSTPFVAPPGEVFKVTSVSMRSCYPDISQYGEVIFSLDAFRGAEFIVPAETVFDVPESVDAMFFFRTSSPVTAKLPGSSERGRRFWSNAHTIVGFDGTVYKSEGQTTGEGHNYADRIGL